jgi:uncharacterized sodium:solute symporter family permease YidK
VVYKINCFIFEKNEIFLGGLSAVIWTDFIQTIIMIIAAFILMIISYIRVGGLQIIKELYPYSIAVETRFNDTLCGIPPKDYFSVIRPLNSDDGPPWVGIFGMTILSIWYWCSDQVRMKEEFLKYDSNI